MCCPGISVGSRSQLQTSCPLTRNASLTMPENSQAIKTLEMVYRSFQNETRLRYKTTCGSI